MNRNPAVFYVLRDFLRATKTCWFNSNVDPSPRHPIHPQPQPLVQGGLPAQQALG